MWQPIETAPKDGSFILLATPKGRIADGFWSPVYGEWSWPYVMVEPTHWMPLPELPSAHPTPSVPDGWKLVPIEPTPGMIDAAEYVDWGDADVRGSCINAWNRMLSVAPEAKP